MPLVFEASGFQALSTAQRFSMFSCDIAYSRSPAASRASASLAKAPHQTIFLLRHSATRHIVRSKAASLSAPRPRRHPRTNVMAPRSRTSYTSALTSEEDREGVPPPVSDAVMATIGVAALDRHLVGGELDVWVVQREV